MDEFVYVFERVSLKSFVPLLLLGMALFLGALAVMDWKAYLREVENLARPEVRVARYPDALPDEINACGITDRYRMDRRKLSFLVGPADALVVPLDTANLTADICPGQNLVWILSPIYQNRLSELQAQWPGGTVENHRLENGDLMFTSYLISNQTNP